MSCAFSCIGPDEALRLRDEHAFLDRQLGEAIALAEADDWAGFEIKWDAFMSALTRHIKYEENSLLPAYAKSGLTAKLEAKQLRTEHENILGEVTFLDGESQVPDIFIEELRHFAQTLREHKAQEERGLYPWLESLHSAENSEEMNKLDVCCSASQQEDTAWRNPLRHEPRTLYSIR